MSQPIRGQGGHLVFPIDPKNTNLVEDIEILLPVKFRWIPFSGFREEVENVSANQRPGRPSCFSDRPEKHKLGRGHWDLASCQVSLNSVKWFQRRSRKCEKLTTDGRTTDGRRTDGRTTDDGQRMITIVHLSLRLRCTNKRPKGPHIVHLSTMCHINFVATSWFSNRLEKHKLGSRHWDLASYQVSSNSIQRFQRSSKAKKPFADSMSLTQCKSYLSFNAQT